MNNEVRPSNSKCYSQANKNNMGSPGLNPPGQQMFPGMMPMQPGFQQPSPMFPVQPYMPGMPIPWPLNGSQEGPPTTTDINYIAAFLKTQIGSMVTVDFLIGTNMFMDRTGVLVEVGANYIILRELESNNLLLCDLYSIKFVKFYKR